MKTFEEMWTAWLDGQLAGRELAEFEASLPDRAAAEAERLGAQKLGTLLKRELSVDTLANEEFFSHQIRERIAREDATSSTGASYPSAFWTIRRLFWAGATSLALFFVCAFFVARQTAPSDQSEYLTQILNSRVDPAVSPNATITIFEAKEDRVTVLWTEGLQSLPSDYAAK